MQAKLGENDQTLDPNNSSEFSFRENEYKGKKLKRDEKNAEYMKKELSSIPKTHKYFPLYAGLIKLMQIKKMDTAFVSTFD